MKRSLMIVLLFMLGTVGYWLLQPSPIDAIAWNPPPKPALEGAWEPNELLEEAHLIGKGEVHGPEGTAIDQQGRLHAGTGDGWIVRETAAGQIEPWVNTGGRPLGMAFDAEGNLIVADSGRGLLSVSRDGSITTLATEAEGIPFGFTDDLDIAPDGTIYFSDASSRFHQADYKLDLLEGRPHGRLLKYEPGSGEVEVLGADLNFANGVAVDPDERFVLVNETWRYRVMRYWLEGKKAGEREVFVDNLPGFPDNLSRDASGRFWLALPTLRNDSVDSAHPYPWLKELIAKLPESIQPQPEAYGLIAVLSPEGEVMASFHDTDGSHLQEITSVEPAGDFLYFGSLHNDRIGKLALSQLSLSQ